MTDSLMLEFRPGLLEGQAAFVTGGTSGIDAAKARLFHALGAKVVAIGASINVPLVEDERLSVIELDVTNPAILERAIRSLSRLDHLVLCAGISLNSDELEIDSFRLVRWRIPDCMRPLPKLKERCFEY